MSRKPQRQNNLSLSSQSEISDDDSLEQQQPRILKNNGNTNNYYNHTAKNQYMNSKQSSEQEDSDQGQPYFRQQNVKNQLLQKQQQRIDEISNEQQASSEEQSQQSHSSIDYIEQRIKKLEKDLQDRLQRHKVPNSKKPLQNQKIQDKIVYSNKMFSQPPRPQKTKLDSKSPKEPHLTNAEMQMLIQPKNIVNDIKNTYNQQIGKQTYCQSVNKQKDKEIKITKAKTKQNEEDKKLMKLKNSQNTKSRQPKQQQKKVEQDARLAYNPQDKKNSRKLKQMQRTIQELLDQNKKLKAKLKSLEKAPQAKKKSAIQVVQLQQVASQIDGKNTQHKLQKQLELLQVIQKLQSKLKHSIGRKLSQMKSQSSSAILLHKGMPASTIHH